MHSLYPAYQPIPVHSELHLLLRTEKLYTLPTDVCVQCGHVIATHKYTFSVDEGYQVGSVTVTNPAHFTCLCVGVCVWGGCVLYLQEYSMECSLCGHGEATVSVLPDDPRGQALF